MVLLGAQGPSQSLIVVRGLAKTYRRGSEELHVLQGIDLDVEKGDFVAFMGPSGSGKTTLLNLLGGLDVPSHGSITVAGDEITHLSGPKLTRWRARHVGFIFQMYNLIPVLSAFRNVELPLLLAPLSGKERRQPGGDRRSGSSASRTAWATSRGSSRGASSSAWPSPAPSWPIPPSFSATSPRATSTARAPTTSWSCWSGS